MALPHILPNPLVNDTAALTLYSDYSGNHTKLSKILLNGNNICMVGAPHRRRHEPD